MIENPDKHKLKKLEKIYSPQGDEFKHAQKPHNTFRRSEECVMGEKIKRILQSINLFNLFKKRTPDKYYSIPRPRYTVKEENSKNTVLLFLAYARKCSTIVKMINLKNIFRNNRKIYLKKGLALVTIIAVIITAYFQNSQPVSAATFTLYQTA